MKEENLIFIISQPRAGSTYLQNLLSNNDQVNTCSEPWLLLNFANQIKSELVNAKFDNSLALRAFENYKEKFNIDFNKKQKEFLLELYKPMLKGFDLIIDKTPRYWEILDEIHELFPSSKIIILKRNPVDVAESIIKTWEIKDLDELSDFKRDLLLAPSKIQSFITKNGKKSNIYCLRYEDLVNDTHEQVKKLYNWIGIEYNSNVMNTEKNDKFKGEFGDPFQNGNDYLIERKRVHSTPLSNTFNKFLIGYGTFLGNSFLKNYGRYDNEIFNRKEKFSFKYYKYFANNGEERSWFKIIIWHLKKKILRGLLEFKN